MNTKSLPLYIGLGIPVLMVLIIAGIAFIPGWFAPKPQYSFVYLAGGEGGGYSSYSPQYQVRDGKIVMFPPTATPSPNMPVINQPPLKLYLYDVIKNEAREITLGEAQLLTIDDRNEAPDGYQYTYSYGGGGGMMELMYDGVSRFNGEARKYYLSGHNTKFEIKLIVPAATSSYSYYGYGNSPRFLGWVTHGWVNR